MSDGDLYVRTEGGNIPLRFKLSIGRENERGDVVPLVSMPVREAAEALLASRTPSVSALVEALESLAEYAGYIASGVLRDADELAANELTEAVEDARTALTNYRSKGEG